MQIEIKIRSDHKELIGWGKGLEKVRGSRVPITEYIWNEKVIDVPDRIINEIASKIAQKVLGAVRVAMSMRRRHEQLHSRKS